VGRALFSEPTGRGFDTQYGVLLTGDNGRRVVEVRQHDGVTEWRFSTRLSRATGFTASAYLTDDGVLMDSGIPGASAEFSRLLGSSEVHGAMITHHHEDHAGNTQILAARDTPLWIAASTLPYLRTVAPIRAYRRYTWYPMAPLHAVPQPFHSARYEAIHTPGHAPDHHVFWDASTRTVFGGDLFLGVAVRVCHHDEDPWTSMASLERVAALNPERLFDGHRGIVVDAAAALRDKVAWMREMIARITSRIERGDGDAAILRNVLGGESLTGRASFGEYSRMNLVRAVRRGLRVRAGAENLGS
jgi:glyoxylase-like metal-dependent hydrolase (beta-lactamase superfamily II)